MGLHITSVIKKNPTISRNKGAKLAVIVELKDHMLPKHVSVCVCAETLTWCKASTFLWGADSLRTWWVSLREVAAQSSSAVLNLSSFPSYKPSLQSEEHNVQFFNGSRPRHSGSLLCALPQCKHLIRIARVSSIAAKCNSRTTSLWSPPSKGRFSSLG